MRDRALPPHVVHHRATDVELRERDELQAAVFLETALGHQEPDHAFGDEIVFVDSVAPGQATGNPPGFLKRREDEMVTGHATMLREGGWGD